MQNQTVLVVDDEEKILQLVKSYLEINGFHALCAKSAGAGMELFEQHTVDLILLDLMLPDFSGEEFCRRVREVSAIPIIMITARVDEEDIIRGLGMGADDYVCKPFSPRQLVARVQAAVRRDAVRMNAQHGSASSGIKENILSSGDLVVDTESRLVTIKGDPVSLTRDEYHILTLLMSRQAKIFTRDEILQYVKGDDYDGFDRAVDTHIKNLRAKLGDDPRSPRYIVTAHGIGYRFGADN
ncbi:DNA-binding response regulator [Spirochaetia bacterium]|nr:DNA-binding response regulator [Spirochaetia bacterium]